MTGTITEEGPETPSPRHAEEPPRHRAAVNLLVPLLLVLAGVSVLLYPVVATQFNNVKQQQFAARYNSQVQEASPDVLAQQLERAHAYNSTLSGVPILDPYLEDVSKAPSSGSYSNYLHTLDAFDAMARIRVPSGQIDLPVYHGTSQETLARGAGHLYGTSLPVGGDNTHAVLTSHTGLSSATLFDHLTQVKIGDLMYVDVYGQTLAYQVDSIKVVLPTQTDDLRVVPGKDLLTLFTCTPYAVNTHRLLVTGHRVPFTAAASAPATPVSSLLRLQPWMYGLLGGAVAVLLLLVLVVAREIRRAGRGPSRALP